MKKILTIAALIFVFALGACTVTTAHAEQDNPVKIWLHNTNGQMQTWVVVDEETGVNYIALDHTRIDSGTAITPRLNPDGTLYISE